MSANKVEELIGKMFLVDGEEWEVEEILLYGKRCVCRSYYSDNTKQFYCDFVKNQVETYEDDLKKLEKKRNAIVFEEEDEKDLLKEIVIDFSNNKNFSQVPTNQLKTLQNIEKKLGLKTNNKEFKIIENYKICPECSQHILKEMKYAYKTDWCPYCNYKK